MSRLGFLSHRFCSGITRCQSAKNARAVAHHHYRSRSPVSLARRQWL